MHQKVLIFTDLDGSLLDHNNYSYAAAKPLLERLDNNHVPVIPVTSKTCAELELLRGQLGNQHPFVVENGSGVFIPNGYFQAIEQETLKVGDYHLISFSRPRSYWQSLLQELKAQFQGSFTTFSELDTEGIMQVTGLSRDGAVLANRRDFSEPVHWIGDDAYKVKFISLLVSLGATVLQGGRFLHVTGGCDKGKAVNWLLHQYQKQEPACQFVTIAAGDSQNDAAMLEAVDKPVVIRSPVQSLPSINHPALYITEYFGPEGWAEGVSAQMTSLAKDSQISNSLSRND